MVSDLQRRVRDLETAARATNTSQRGGAFTILDALTSAEVVRLGELDGDYGLFVNGARVDAVAVAVDKGLGTNVSLNTTAASKVSCALDVPTWCNRALVVGFATAQIDNSSGGLQLLSLGVRIEGVNSGGMDTLVSNGDIEAVASVDAQTIDDPGATITVDGYAHVSVGTNAVNKIRLTAIGLFLRV
jgi:hypothetical protein